MTEAWELIEEAEDGSWESFRTEDPSYSLWASADTEGHWIVGHVTWSREDGTEEHEDHEGDTEDLGSAQAAALAKLVEMRDWADAYERQIDEQMANEATELERIRWAQEDEDQVRGEVI